MPESLEDPEDALVMPGVDPAAVVGHGELPVIFPLLAGDFHHSGGTGMVLRGVVQEIPEDETQKHLVGLESRHGAGESDLNLPG